MSVNVNVTIPDNIARYLTMKSKTEYLPMSAIVRQYLAKSVVEEMVIKYHSEGYSISKIAQMTDSTIFRVMQILRTLGEETEDMEEVLDQIENGIFP